MKDSKKLVKLQKEMKELERAEMQCRGSLDTLHKALKKDLGIEKISDHGLTVAIKERIKELKQKIVKSKKLFQEKMEQIEEMSKEEDN